MLPQAFLNRMESMLGNEYPAFLESYDKDKYQALRLNSIKGDTAQMKEKVPFSLQPVAWAKDGFYYEKDDTPGRHPLHEAGVYYIQEPSAMAPVSYLMEDYDVVQKEAADCQERILDLCAAPGGKAHRSRQECMKCTHQGSGRSRDFSSAMKSIRHARRFYLRTWSGWGLQMQW